MPVAWILPASVKGRRCIGGFLAGTFVIAEATETPDKTTWLDGLAESYAALKEKQFPLPPSAASKLVAEDLNLIEYLGGRLQTATAQRRRQTLREIAARYAKRLELDDRLDEITAAPDRFLRELGLQLRQQFDRIDQ